MRKEISLANLTVERLNNGQPILSAVHDHPWESEVVFNPACVLLEDHDSIQAITSALALPESLRDKLEGCEAVCVLIYRAQGGATESEDYRHSRLGIALLSPTLELIYRHPLPIMIPDEEFDDLGVEDPRISRVDGKYVMFYTGYSSHSKSKSEPSRSNSINICIALSDDLVNWEKKGKLKGVLDDIDNKNAMLFPEKIGGTFRMFHRPMEGSGAMTIHTAHSDSIMGEWTDDGVFMSVNEDTRFTKSWIGGGAPPLQVGDDEYLALYHTGHFKPDGTREYDLGLCKIEFAGVPKVVERIEPFMIPHTSAETLGNKSLGVNNVLFVCGAYLFQDYLYFPYAGADSVILAARIKFPS